MDVQNQIANLADNLVCINANMVTWTIIIYLTTLLTSPIEFSLYFQNYARHLNQNFRVMRKIYETGLRRKNLRVNLFYKVP